MYCPHQYMFHSYMGLYDSCWILGKNQSIKTKLKIIIISVLSKQYRQVCLYQGKIIWKGYLLSHLLWLNIFLVLYYGYTDGLYWYMYASWKVCKIQFFENIVLEMFKYLRFYSTFQLENLTCTLKLHTFLSIQCLKFNENSMNLSILCPRHQIAVPNACISFKSYLLPNTIEIPNKCSECERNWL